MYLCINQVQGSRLRPVGYGAASKVQGYAIAECGIFYPQIYPPLVDLSAIFVEDYTDFRRLFKVRLVDWLNGKRRPKKKDPYKKD